MKNSKKSNIGILVAFLLGLLVVAFKVLFISPEDSTFEQDAIASERVNSLLIKVDSINFNLEALEDYKFASLKSIELPLVQLPIGRLNPFSNKSSN